MGFDTKVSVSRGVSIREIDATRSYVERAVRKSRPHRFIYMARWNKIRENWSRIASSRPPLSFPPSLRPPDLSTLAPTGSRSRGTRVARIPSRFDGPGGERTPL